jgi:hypothetical protein
MSCGELESGSERRSRTDYCGKVVA